jgi:hypothetical protein
MKKPPVAATVLATGALGWFGSHDTLSRGTPAGAAVLTPGDALRKMALKFHVVGRTTATIPGRGGDLRLLRSVRRQPRGSPDGRGARP